MLTSQEIHRVVLHLADLNRRIKANADAENLTRVAATAENLACAFETLADIITERTAVTWDCHGNVVRVCTTE